ncbi:hypothetical protein BDZ97DRAFT_139935 [Flammula alnicola]|nr:hypothetical protein BDZ97DRAFT_139935 [Flammula alnicola]
MDVQDQARKRQRTDSFCNIGEPNVPVHPSYDSSNASHPALYDETYYKPDGDCVILVEGVLFKLHRFLLARDSSAFADMLNIPTGDKEDSQAMTEENPLVLQDNIKNFRALCWILYALPNDIQKQNKKSHVDFPRLISVLSIANKYHFDSHEQWAGHMLMKHCPRLDLENREHFLFNCPIADLQEFIHVSDIVDMKKLRTFGEGVWIHRLKDQPNESTAIALDFGHKLGLRKFLGRVYYCELSRMAVQKERSAASLFSDNDMSTAQNLALYRGFWSLSRYWPQFLTKGMELACTKPDHECCKDLGTFWKDLNKLFTEPTQFDPIREITLYLQELHECPQYEVDLEARSCLEAHLLKLIKMIEDSCAEHFLGPLPQREASTANDNTYMLSV